jgi:hypothetical protein
VGLAAAGRNHPRPGSGEVDLGNGLKIALLYMLFDDERCGELRIWGVPVREEAKDD